MAFDKLIIKGITNAAKSGIKLDIAIDSLKTKLIDSTTKQIESQVPVNLPFSIKDVLNGGSLPQDLLSPDTVNSVERIPEGQKQQINNTLDNIEANLNAAVVQKNSLQNGLSTITSPLTTLETLSDTIGGAITGINTAVTVIKTLPIPSSVPPGIGIPLNVINGFSSALDTLKITLDKFGGPLKIIPSSIDQINAILVPIVGKLNSLNEIFDKLYQIIAFIRLLLSAPITQSDVDTALQDITAKLQQSLAISVGPSSTSIENDALLSSLDPNSNNPLFYKGFRLILEFDPNNTFSFPARRIKAENNKGVKLYSVPPDQGSGEVNTSSSYSFSSSTEVLINEVKFNIDQYLIKNPQRLIEKSIPVSPFAIPANSTTSGTAGTAGTSSTNGYLPFGFPGSVSGEVKFRSGKAWRWLGDSQNKWVEHTISFDPFTEKGINGTERFIKTTQNPYPRAYYKWDETLYKWVFQRIVTG